MLLLGGLTLNQFRSGRPGIGKDRGGASCFDADSCGHWDSRGLGCTRDVGFGGSMRDEDFGGRGDARAGNFGRRGDTRGGGFDGRGGMRGGGFSAYEGRNDMFSGRQNRGWVFRGHGGSNVGWGRNDHGPHDRYNSNDGHGRGCVCGRGQFDNRRDIADRSCRGRSHSCSPDRVRTWGYSSRSRSRSRSRSHSRSWSHGHSRSPSPNHNCSCSCSYDRYEKPCDRKDRRVSGFDVLHESRMLPMIPAAPMPQACSGVHYLQLNPQCYYRWLKVLRQSLCF